MLPLSEKVKVLDLMRKRKKSFAGVAKIYSKIETSMCEIVKKEKKFVLPLLSHLELRKLQPQYVIS